MRIICTEKGDIITENKAASGGLGTVSEIEPWQ